MTGGRVGSGVCVCVCLAKFGFWENGGQQAEGRLGRQAGRQAGWQSEAGSRTQNVDARRRSSSVPLPMGLSAATFLGAERRGRRIGTRPASPGQRNHVGD